MSHIINLVKVIILIAAALFFAFNTQKVTIIFIPDYYYKENIPLWFPLLASFFAGVVICAFSFLLDKIKTGRRIKDLKKQLEAMSKELVMLKNMPALDDPAKKDVSTKPVEEGIKI